MRAPWKHASKGMRVRELMRRDVDLLEPYPPPPLIADVERALGRPVVKLDANENPYGPSPLVAPAMAACCVERYPDAGCTQFRQGLSRYLGVDPARILCSTGGDEMLDLLTRLFLEPGDEVIDIVPAFVMYPIAGLFNRGNMVSVPRVDGFAVDVEAVERAVTARTKIIFLCNPNNPTGNATPLPDIIRILETNRVVVLDEAYAEFAGFTWVHLVEQYPNLIVLRTMSKWAALAGLRLGYAIMDPQVALDMTRVRPPYNVGAAAQAAGIASLQDREYLMANVERIIQERERLRARLESLPFGRVHPSLTNFLFWTTDRAEGGPSAVQLKAALAQRGVMIRAFEDPVDALRFSIGTPAESDALLTALEETYVELAG